MRWAPDGNTLAATCSDGTLWHWDPNYPDHSLSMWHVGTRALTDLDWNSDGSRFVCASKDGRVTPCDPLSLKPRANEGKRVSGESVECVAWAPDGDRLAAAGDDGKLYLLNAGLDIIEKGIGHHSPVRRLKWCDGDATLVSASDAGFIGVWIKSEVDNQLRHFLPGGPNACSHANSIQDLAWSKQTCRLASAAADRKIRLWNVASRELIATHDLSEPPTVIEFSPAGDMLVTRTRRRICFLRPQAGQIDEIYAFSHPAGENCGSVSINVHSGLLAAENSFEGCIDLWEVDFAALSRNADITSRSYSNAKVVFCGQRNSGKTNLALALSGAPFNEAASEHGMQVHTRRLDTIYAARGVCEIREIAYWDLPNHNRYELVQNLHLSSANATVTVFDCGSITAEEIQGWPRQLPAGIADDTPGSRLFVLNKADRVTEAQVYRLRAAVQSRFQTSNVYVTSARDDEGIDELRKAVSESLNWSRLPRSEFGDVFWELQKLVDEQKRKEILFTYEQPLYELFIARHSRLRGHDFEADFQTSLQLLENLGTMCRYSLGGQVLLEPSFEHAYAAALIAAAGRDKQGMGRIPAEQAYSGRQSSQFQLKDQQRIRDRRQESLLLTAIIGELLNRELIYQVGADTGNFLVFPTQPTRELEGMPAKKDRAASAVFKGDSQQIYSSLVVRLLGLEVLFSDPEPYHNAAVFTAKSGGSCGVILEQAEDEDGGDISVFFDEQAGPATRQQFREFVRSHIAARAVPDTLKWTAQETVNSTRQAGQDSSRKIDVFFCYEQQDLKNVEVIANDLKRRQINPWLEDWSLIAGGGPQERLRAMEEHRVAVIALRNSSLSEKLRNDCSILKARKAWIIPVILPTADSDMRMPAQLRDIKPVDFHTLGEEPYNQLAHGVEAGFVATEPVQKSFLPQPHPVLQQLPSKSCVFLSYCSVDKPAVARLRRDLIRAGHTVWWADDILGGQNWQIAVHEALSQSYAVVVCWSAKSTRRNETGIYPEVQQALSILERMQPNSVFLIPVRLSTCTIPPIQLHGTGWFSDLNAIDVYSTNRARNLDRLVEALNTARQNRSNRI